MAEQFGDKTHEATPYRREQARREGQVPRSQDLVSAVLLIGALLLLMYWGPGAATYLAALTERQLGGSAWLTIDRDTFIGHWHSVVFGLGQTLLPLFGCLVLIAVTANMFQVGFLFLPEKLSFDFSRVDPLKGTQRLFSLTNLVRLGLGLLKILLVGAVAIWSVWSQAREVMGSGGQEIGLLAIFIIQITLWTSLKIGVALLILALIDYAYQRWKFEQDLRMTDQEMREELKNLQGDPQIIARRRMVQRQLALNRLGTAVPEADVVVTNPTELAIAIKYDPEEMAAPIVVAKGAGTVAQRIRRLALENNIPVVERKELARALYKEVEIDHPVPQQRYAAVAEVLRYVYELRGEMPPALQNAA